MPEYPKITILIVDDEMSIRRLLDFYLKKFFNVATAADGEKAMTWLKKGNVPDVIIADFNMPGINGLELTRYIRNKPELNEIPVIILSGSESEEQQLECSEAGASEYILKPFRPEELHKLIVQKLKDSEKV